MSCNPPPCFSTMQMRHCVLQTLTRGHWSAHVIGELCPLRNTVKFLLISPLCALKRIYNEVLTLNSSPFMQGSGRIPVQKSKWEHAEEKRQASCGTIRTLVGCFFFIKSAESDRIYLNDHQWAHGIEHRCVGGGLGHGNILWNYKSTPKKPANHGQRPFLMRCPVQSFRPFKLTREKSWKKCHGHWIQRNISTT